MTPLSNIVLHPIARNGDVPALLQPASGAAADALKATIAFYEKVDFNPPWISYLALADSRPVGICSFASPLIEECIEIAYYTFPRFEGRGVATSMAAQLVAIGLRKLPTLTLTAQTLPGRNASHRVLEKLGFTHIAALTHPEEGEVWEWRLLPKPQTGG